MGRTSGGRKRTQKATQGFLRGLGAWISRRVATDEASRGRKASNHETFQTGFVLSNFKILAAECSLQGSLNNSYKL